MPRKASSATPKAPKTPRKSRSRRSVEPKFTQPPAPAISFRVGPTPIVSGYATTGVPGPLNSGYSTTGVTIGNLDPRASRLGISASGSAFAIRYGNDNYSQGITGTPNTNNFAVPVGQFTSEPRVESALFSGSPGGVSYSLSSGQQRQAAAGSDRSYLSGQVRNGLYSGDTMMQNIAENVIPHTRPVDTYNAHVEAPVNAVPQNLNQLFTASRQDEQPSGSVNNVSRIRVTMPQGQPNVNYTNDRHTPALSGYGYTAPGTHPVQAAPSYPFDGSWTIDVLPGGQQQPGLADLAPAADVPVQTYSGSRPRSTSINASRPLGQSYPTFQRGVRVSA